MKTSLKLLSLPLLALTLVSLTSFAAPQPSSRCTNVFVETSGNLGAIEVAPGVFTLVALPTAMTLGNIPGQMSSVVTSFEPSGAKGQGAQHVTLIHTFVSDDGESSFTTADRAVCAPAGSNPLVCRVNDVLTIVSGTGVFENANGSLRNHGIIDLTSFSLTISLRGRVCGDGL